MSEFITTKQAAEILNIHPTTLRRWEKTSKLRAHRNELNGYRQYRKADIDAVLRGLETKTQNNFTLKQAVQVHKINSVTNPNSVHGIYPYRGKISSVDAASIIKQLKPGKLLDPFCGSGTILYEANLAGIDAVGIDNNPLAVWIAKGKISSLSGSRDTFLKEVDVLINRAQVRKFRQYKSPLLSKAFHNDTLQEVLSVTQHFSEMSDYVRACFLGAVALTARGCNQYKWTSSSVGKDIQPKQYINFYEKFKNKVHKHIYNDKTSKNSCYIHLHDSRNLTKKLKGQSIDYVFTSPPYFDALDYTAYYGRILYDLLGKNHLEIKKALIQSVSEYKEDMKRVFHELLRVTKKNSLIIFVVGDKKFGGQIINGGDYFSQLLHYRPNIVIERSYTGSSSQIFDKINKTHRREQIVVWDRSTWK